MASKVRIILGLPEGVFAGARAMGVLRQLHRELASVIGSCPRPEDPKWKRAVWIFQHIPGRDRSCFLKIWRDRKGLRRAKSAYIAEKLKAGLTNRPAEVAAIPRMRLGVRHVQPGMPLGQPAPQQNAQVDRWNIWADPPQLPWQDEEGPNG